MTTLFKIQITQEQIIRSLRVGRGPMASDLIYLCKCFQIFGYFISYSTKFASSCCCNTMFLYVLRFSAFHVSLRFTFLYVLRFSTFYVSLCFTFLYILCFSFLYLLLYVSPSFIHFSTSHPPLSIFVYLAFLHLFLYISFSVIHFSMSLYPLPFITLSPSPFTIPHPVQLVLNCDKYLFI
jgi:hypothetical protein